MGKHLGKNKHALGMCGITLELEGSTSINSWFSKKKVPCSDE